MINQHCGLRLHQPNRKYMCNSLFNKGCDTGQLKFTTAILLKEIWTTLVLVPGHTNIDNLRLLYIAFYKR